MSYRVADISFFPSKTAIFTILLVLLLPFSYAEDDRTAQEWFNIGVGYSEMGMHKEAIAGFRQAIGLAPDFAEAHLALGISYFYSGDSKSARDEYSILSDLNPQMAEELFRIMYKSDF